MGFGLEIYDPAGVKMMDASTLVGRLIAIIDCNTASGSAVVTGLDQGVPFGIPMVQLAPSYPSGTHSYPDCTYSGNTVSWTRQTIPGGPSLPPCKLVLGVR